MRTTISLLGWWPPKAWYSGPDQELLRREVAWTLKWMRRPLPALVLILYAILTFLDEYFLLQQISFFLPGVPIGPGTITPAPASSLHDTYYVISRTSLWSPFRLLKLPLFLGFWWFLVSRRTLRPFSPKRISDLLLTPITQRQLWPGLLAAPVIGSTAMILVGAISRAAGRVIAGYSPEFASGSVLLMAIEIPVMTISHLAIVLGLTAFTASCCIPRQSMILSSIFLVVGFGIVLVSAKIFQLGYALVYVAVTQEPVIIDPFLDTWPTFVLSPLVMAVSALVLWFWALRKLRSRTAWRRIQDSAGSM